MSTSKNFKYSKRFMRHLLNQFSLIWNVKLLSVTVTFAAKSIVLTFMCDI